MKKIIFLISLSLVIMEVKAMKEQPSHSKSSKHLPTSCADMSVDCYLNQYGGKLGTVGPFHMHWVKNKEFCSPLTFYYCCIFMNNSYNNNLVTACVENGYPNATYATMDD